jgi:hypothetical protein
LSFGELSLFVGLIGDSSQQARIQSEKKKTREKKKDGNSSSWAAEFKRITIMGI